MSWLRLIGSDLVEKRLWPLAVLLVLATVSLPVIMVQTASRARVAGAGPALQPQAAGAAITPQLRGLIARIAPTPSPQHASGHLHNPFITSATAKAAPIPGRATLVRAAAGGASARTVAPAASSSGAPATSARRAPSPAPGSATITVTPRTGTAPEPRKRLALSGATSFTVDLRFGQAAGAREVPHPVRLSPLPSKLDPELVYLGVRRGSRTALFLVAGGATVAGDGRCLPSPSECQILSLGAGDTEFVDVASPTAGLVQYELDLVRIRMHHPGSAAAATKINRRVSAAGLAVLRAARSPLVAGLTLSPLTGLLVVRTPGGARPTIPSVLRADPAARP